MIATDNEFYSSPYYFLLRDKGDKYSLYFSVEGTLTEARKKDEVIHFEKSKGEKVKKHLKKVANEKKVKNTKTLKSDLEELVNADGAMSNSKIPILDPKLHPKKTMDQTVQAARNVYDIFRMGYRRYFSETDMAKAFGYDETKFMNAKETIKYLEKELGLDSEDAEDRAEEMGKKPKMDKKSEFKDLKNFVNRGVIAEKDVDEVKEEIISKKSNDREITEKSKISSKVISRNVTAEKSMNKEMRNFQVPLLRRMVGMR